MPKRRLDFEVDKLTNSIEDVLTGEVFETEVVRLNFSDTARLRKLKWAFDWTIELQNGGREVHALTKKVVPIEWHGLMSSEDLGDHIYLHLLENAPFNRGRKKRYDGVAGNLVAFLCKTSFERGYEGIVVFEPKTRLIAHYEKTLRAQLFAPNRMFIPSHAAYNLVKRYFTDFQR